MANRSRNILLRLTGDSTDAKRAVTSVRNELRAFSREQATAHVDVQILRAEQQLLRFRRQLDEISRSDATPEVKLAGAEAVSLRIERLELRLARLNRRKVTIDVDVKRGGFERIAAGIASVDRGLDGAAKGFGNFFRAIPVVGQMFAVVIDGVVSLGNAIGSMVTSGVSGLARLVPALAGVAGPIGSLVGIVFNVAAGLAGLAALGGAVIIVLNAIAGAIVALAGAAVALVASLAAAAGGLVAMGVAIGGLLVPVLIVAVALFQRFHAILQARQAREQALTQSIQEQKTAEQSRAAALTQVKTAQQQLADATVAGNRAMTQSVQDLRDAQLGLESSQLGVKEARLNMLEAQRALRQFLAQAGATGPTLNSLVKKFSNVSFDPSQAGRVLGASGVGGASADPLALQQKILAVQRAQLGVKEAINQTAHAEDTLSQATKKRADFVRRGLDAYKPYRQALQAVAQAEARLQRAQDATSRAHDKYERALRKLSTTEKGTLSRLDEFLAKFKEIAKAITDPVFAALNDAFDKLKGTSSGLLGPLTAIGVAMGDVIRALATFIAQPATLSAFRTMATGAAKLVRELGAHAFISFLTIMREVAVKALPAVESAARGVSRWLGRIADQPGRIRSVVGTLIDQFKTWLKFAGAVSRLVLALFSNAAPAGRSLAVSMTRIVDRWTRWLHENPGAVRAFFDHAVRQTKQIVHWLAEAVNWLRIHLPKAADTAKHAFDTVYNVIKKIVDAIKFINDAAHGKFTIFGHTINLPGPADVPISPLGSVVKHLNDAAKGGQGGLEDAITKAGAQAIIRGLQNGSKIRRAPNEPRAGSAGVHLHVTVPGGGSPDPRTLATKLERELRLTG